MVPDQGDKAPSKKFAKPYGHAVFSIYFITFIATFFSLFFAGWHFNHFWFEASTWKEREAAKLRKRAVIQFSMVMIVLPPFDVSSIKSAKTWKTITIIKCPDNLMVTSITETKKIQNMISRISKVSRRYEMKINNKALRDDGRKSKIIRCWIISSTYQRWILHEKIRSRILCPKLSHWRGLWSYLWSIALYEWETWILRKADRNYLVSFEMWSQRS